MPYSEYFHEELSPEEFVHRVNAKPKRKSMKPTSTMIPSGKVFKDVGKYGPEMSPEDAAKYAVSLMPDAYLIATSVAWREEENKDLLPGVPDATGSGRTNKLRTELKSRLYDWIHDVDLTRVDKVI